MKKIGIGYENYKRIIDDGCYYVDKTLLIRDIVEKGGMVTLFTRPRRFGKTLALSTIRTFFECEYDHYGNRVDNSRYFEDKRIMGAPDDILSKMGQYPIINLSLKSAKQPNFYAAFIKLKEDIIREFDRHRYILESDKLSNDKIDAYKRILRGNLDWEDKLETIKDENEEKKALEKEMAKYSTSIRFLCECLKSYFNKNTIILIDEYDVPLENAYFQGFYDEMVGFIRSLFESAIKTNDSLEFAVITGCIRISKESIFTGMNNLQINSIRSNDFNEGFGFTDEEVVKMLEDYDIADKVEEAREWYDGYVFGETEIYNPWSITQYVKMLSSNKNRFPEPFWANTSSNQIIKEMVYDADEDMREELDSLISGGTIEKKIHEDITYGDIHESEDNLWNFLFFTGYMRLVSERKVGRDIYVTMRIPNDEIKYIYENQMSTWFEKVVKAEDRNVLHKAILAGDTETMSDYVSNLLGKSISYFDSNESFYHGYFTSLLYGVPRYNVRTNREEGDGRADVVLYPNRPKDYAILFEIKIRKKFNEIDAGIEEAFNQIREKRYEEGILDDGYAGVVSYGVCFCKKNCEVRKYR